jgi:hypothetical protein
LTTAVEARPRNVDDLLAVAGTMTCAISRTLPASVLRFNLALLATGTMSEATP